MLGETSRGGHGTQKGLWSCEATARTQKFQKGPSLLVRSDSFKKKMTSGTFEIRSKEKGA